MALPHDHSERTARARLSLNGVSLGDAFGERFFVSPSAIEFLIENRALPGRPWFYTDDTVMALSIVEVLELRGEVDQDLLAEGFARKYAADTSRGYGPGAHRILRELAAGEDWRDVSRIAFGGSGSLGNGGAMRAAPVGAYFEGDPERAALEAQRSAEVTHAHPEGQAGAMAVAAAAACARSAADGSALFEAAIAHTPAGATRDGLEAARDLSTNTVVEVAASVLGNGSQVTAPDTVPFTLWCAARHLGNFEEAMWQTVAGLGDRDTTCAIVGGIVVLSPGGDAIPSEWFESRESLGRLAKLGTHAT